MQIVEINESRINQDKKEIVVGIDFGTTNSLISYCQDNNQKVIKMENGSELLPSIITLDYINNKIIVGQYQVNQNYIRSIKRFLAKSTKEILNNENLNKLCSLEFDKNSDIPKVIFNEHKITLIALASEIFVHLKMQAQKELKQEIKKAVVSVPAYFDDTARGQILLAAKIAGLNVIRLIAEPTAAAYAYGLNKKTEGTYLVYDLGGGTFDVSILNMQQNILQIIAIGGDNMIGGDDIDIILASNFATITNTPLTHELVLIAQKAKEALSHKDSISLEINKTYFNISKEDFEKLVTPLIDKTIDIARDTVFDAEIEVLDGIILIGGSTRIPLISKKLRSTFKTTIFSDINPDKAVVLGAALQAKNLSTTSNSLLIDVVPLSLGIGLHGGIVEKIIMRNTPIPFSITKEYTTGIDNQTSMTFQIVQGEREMVKDCRLLASFELKNMPSAKAGMTKIETTFAIDANGILSVTAKESVTGIAHNVEVHPKFGIDEKEINESLMLAFQNANNDYNVRLLIETRLEASNIINGVIKAMKETPEILTYIEKNKIDEAINSLQNVINLDNRSNILECTRYLNKLADNFIQKYLNKGAGIILKGKHIDNIIKQ